MKARDLLSVIDGSLVTLPYSGEWLAGRLLKVSQNSYSGVINVWWKVDRLGLVHATLDPEMSLFPQDHEEETSAVQFTGNNLEEMREFIGANQKDVSVGPGRTIGGVYHAGTFYSLGSQADWVGYITEGAWLVRRKGAIVELDNETYQVLFG